MLLLKTIRSLLVFSLVPSAFLSLSFSQTSNGQINLSAFPFEHPNPVSAWDHLIASLIPPSNFYLAPPSAARMVALTHQAIFDAVNVYSEQPWLFTVTGSQYSILNKAPLIDYNDANRATALSYGAYRVLSNIYQDKLDIIAKIDNFFISIGGNPNDTHTSTDDPIGVGNSVGYAVLETRRLDGFNSEGNMIGSPLNGSRYFDFTNFHPLNPPQRVPSRTNCSELVDVNHWQPLRIKQKDGNTTVQNWANCHVVNAKPFALTDAGMFRTSIEVPCLYQHIGQEVYMQELNEMFNLSANLTDKEKMIVEFWADNDGLSPPAHWVKLNAELAERRNLSLIQTAKAQFGLAWTIYDAALAAWDVKRIYDTARPITAIQCLFAGQQIQSWKAPYLGTLTYDASEWQPYQPLNRPSPNFPNYVSGHSTMSAASAVFLTDFYKSNKFGLSHTIKAGEGVYEPKVTDATDVRYIASKSDVPNSGPGTPGYSPATDVTLSWETFQEAADESGFSRRLAGIHTAGADFQGRKLGAIVGKHVLKKLKIIYGEKPNCKNLNGTFSDF